MTRTSYMNILTTRPVVLTETTEACRSIQKHYSGSKPTHIFILCKYQFYSLWFNPTGAPTHDLPRSSRAR